MNILVAFLMIIILILIIYLFWLKREIRRINSNLDKIIENDTNEVVHIEFNNRELHKLVLKINTLLNYIRNKELELEHKSISLNRQITNIAHDLRTPLTSALGYIELLNKSNLSEGEQEKELKIIESRLFRLEKLINSFFEFSTIGIKNKQIEMEQINIVCVIEECISHYFDDYTKLNRNIIFENTMKKCVLKSNYELFTRVIENLIGNSLKHSNSDLIIKLYEKKGVHIVFENETIDSTKIDVEHIFDEFYTADISRTKENTGLGLAIAKEFTEVLGGKICAKNFKKDFIIELDFNVN